MSVVDAPDSAASRVSRGLGWSLVGSLVLRIGNFAVSIVVARLVVPEEFGIFAVALTVWTILGMLAEFGLGTDLIRSRDPERRAPTVATLAAAASAGLAITMALGADSLAQLFESPGSAPAIRLMAVALGLFGLTVVPSAFLTRAYRQRALFLINLTGLVVSTTVVVVVALDGSGALALAWGQISNYLVLVVGLHVVARRRPRFGFRPEVARESVAFCLPLAVANLLSWLLLSVDNLIVARELGTHQLGLYVLAFNVSSWPMAAIGQAIRVVALPAFSSQESPVERNRALLRCSAPLFAVAALMGMVLATQATSVVALLYGDRWLGAATALAGLAVFGAVRVLLDLVATFLIAVGTTRAVLGVQVVWLVAMVPAMWLGVRWFGLAGAAWTHLVVALGVALPAYAVCLRRVGVDAGAFVRAWTLPLLAAIPATGACLWVATWDLAPLPGLLVGGTTAVVLYALPLAPWWRGRIQVLRAHASGTDDERSST
ncbi:oligosaccharide flippase family protein [Nocardioides donggukensis]|uniref:Oligosaccharide flippase family protein n=1 Tax=Nocardioides donggukensis TaxID=2774019 RepID=A0A927K5V3_9ACTN|nr:oligosaccharide flippase family protein [Nocardioides donggukensis]MBD8870486.1 oligosaccharide flippase family protein [Nocardioides donggukensis]